MKIPPKRPRTADDYKMYKNVLPSSKTINTFKHKKALHQEIMAARALMNKDKNTKVTLHYDTTTRSRIDGDWPCLMLNFSGNGSANQMIPLRPIYFAHGDRKQITDLFVETFSRLEVAANDPNWTAAKLWEQIDAIMSDSVSKNLNIENDLAEQLNSTHVPHHLLCKSHVCSRLDEDNISTLCEKEKNKTEGNSRTRESQR